MNDIYSVKHSRDMGYSLFKYNHVGMFWQQISNWYTKPGDLYRHAIVKHPIAIGINCHISDKALERKLLEKQKQSRPL